MGRAAVSARGLAHVAAILVAPALAACDSLFSLDHVVSVDAPRNCVREAFDGTAIDLGRWVVNDPGNPVKVRQQAGELQIALVSNASGAWYNGIETVQHFDLTAGYAIVELVGATNQVVNADTALSVRVDSLNNYGLDVAEGRLYADTVIDGNLDNSVSIPYSPTDQRFLRIRGADGLVYFEAGPDGQTWTSVRMVAGTLTSVAARIDGGTYGPGASDPGTAHWDNFAIVTPGCTP